MDTKLLTKDLKALPEVRLKLLELARQSAKKGGGLDHEKLKFRYKEIQEASEEAESYTRETQAAASYLKMLAGE